MNILVIIEDSRGSMHRMSKEAIVGAQKMGGSVTALVIGENADSISNELSSYNIEKTLLVKENRTKDLQGNSNTAQCAKAVIDNIN